MGETNNNSLIGAEPSGAAGGRSGSRSFSAPLGAVTAGRLEFTRGASNVTLDTDASPNELCHARFKGPVPRLFESAGTLTVEYPRTFHPLEWRRRAARIGLGSSVSWEVVIRGGVSRLEANLRELRLEAFVVKGGASQVEIAFPFPAGTIPVRLYGGASKVLLLLPEGAAARVRVLGGVSKLAFEEQRFGSVGGETCLQRTGYQEAAHRYDIEILGGASDLKVVPE